MNDIALIAPNEQIVKNAVIAQKKYGFQIDVLTGLMQEGVEIARHCLERRNPPKVLISRGGTALLLQEQLNVPVVEIKIDLPDAVAALKEAMKHGKRILFLGFHNHIRGVKSMEQLLGLQIKEEVLEDWHDAREQIAQAKQEGCDVVIGGAFQQQVAAELGMPFVFLSTGETAIYNGYVQGRAVLEALREEQRKLQEIRTILDMTRDGFVAVDKQGRISLINNSAATMLGSPADRVMGLAVKAVESALAPLDDALAGTRRKDDLISLKGENYLCQTTALHHEGEVVGAMATLKSVNAVKSDETRIRLKQYRDGLYANYRFADILGDSPAMMEAKKLAGRYAAVDSTVLIVSESGTGKEMFAQSIHNGGARREGPFVGINCASLSSSILESELFGYVDGAFTGAQKGGKAGVFEMANNGTIFLDEIGELPPDIQGKLLRVLQERCVMRLGDTKIVPVNVRIIAATNRDLVDDVRRGTFRQDLFFRLDVLHLSIPPLRQRREDIPMLCKHFLSRYGRERVPLSAASEARLQEYSWPGNIRELENLIERLCVSEPEQQLSVIEAHFAMMKGLKTDEFPRQALDRERVAEALNRAGGNKRKAAELLGVHRSTLYRYLEAEQS